jgi:hypothetical protein
VWIVAIAARRQRHPPAGDVRIWMMSPIRAFGFRMDDGAEDDASGD